MYITKIISINSGWEHLSANHKALDELHTMADAFEYENLFEANKTNNQNIINEDLIRPIAFSRLFRSLVKEMKWTQRLPESARAAQGMPKILQLKHGVALDAAFGSPTSQIQTLDRWALVNAVRQQADLSCEVSVLLTLDNRPDWYGLPRIYNGIYHQEHDRGSFDNIYSHIENHVLPLYHKLPLVVVAIDEVFSPIEIIELENQSEPKAFERVMEFTPENYQAGVGILSYFSEILKNKYPDVDAKVMIEQDGYTVRMIVETENGDQEIIEEALNTYTQVVIKKEPPESLLDDKIQISELTMQLTMIEAQLEHKTQLLKLSDERYKNDVIATRDEVAFLRQCLTQQMQLQGSTQVLIGKQIEKEEKLTLAQLGSFNNTIQALLEQAADNSKLIDALDQVQDMLENGVNVKDEQVAKQALQTIQQESPGSYNQLSEILKNSMYGVSGNMIFTWMTELSKVLG